jgi:hypothetical protein
VSATTVSERQGEGWQDIATAPKDGSHVLLFWQEVSRWPVVGWWFAPWDQWRAGNYYCGKTMGKPTHWMPLPAPPIHRSTGEA